jgi:hypothetical protein
MSAETPLLVIFALMILPCLILGLLTLTILMQKGRL